MHTGDFVAGNVYLDTHFSHFSQSSQSEDFPLNFKCMYDYLKILLQKHVGILFVEQGE